MPVVRVHKNFNSLYRTEGTQYIDGTLTISGPTTIELSSSTYTSAGNYILFVYSTLVGSITDITIVPPAGLSVDTNISPNGCSIYQNSILVKLI